MRDIVSCERRRTGGEGNVADGQTMLGTGRELDCGVRDHLDK